MGEPAGPLRAPLVLLETATLLSGAGNGVATVVLPWLILERTGSAAATGLVAAATFLPLLGSSLFAGTLVDLLGRRRCAVTADGLSGLAVAAIPVVDRVGLLTVPTLIALAVVGALFDPVGFTAREVMLPAVAGAVGWRLERANGLHEAVWGLAFLIGPGAGGLLIAMVGATGALWVTAAGFALSALAVGALRVDGVGRPAVSHRPAGVWHGVVEGLAFVWRDRLLRTLALLSGALVAVYLPIEGVILPVYFTAARAPARLGLLITVMGGGGVVGALAYGTWGHLVGRRVVFVGALIATTAAIAVMALLPAYPLLLAVGFCVGLLYGPVNPLVNLALQSRTGQRLRGRVVGVVTSSTYAAGPLGFLLVGPLVQWLGTRTAFLVLAALLLAVSLSALQARSLAELDTLRPPRS